MGGISIRERGSAFLGVRCWSGFIEGHRFGSRRNEARQDATKSKLTLYSPACFCSISAHRSLRCCAVEYADAVAARNATNSPCSARFFPTQPHQPNEIEPANPRRGPTGKLIIRLAQLLLMLEHALHLRQRIEEGIEVVVLCEEVLELFLRV